MTQSPKIQFRLASVADHAAISGLYYSMDVYHAESVPHLCKHGPMPPLSQGALERQLAKEDQRLWVAVADGRVVGLLNMVCEKPRDDHPFLRQPRTVHVHTIVVEVGYRHLGIGKSLLRIAQDWAAETGSERLTLSVFDFNAPARKLYESFGFAPSKLTMVKDL